MLHQLFKKKPATVVLTAVFIVGFLFFVKNANADTQILIDQDNGIQTYSHVVCESFKASSTNINSIDLFAYGEDSELWEFEYIICEGDLPTEHASVTPDNIAAPFNYDIDCVTGDDVIANGVFDVNDTASTSILARTNPYNDTFVPFENIVLNGMYYWCFSVTSGDAQNKTTGYLYDNTNPFEYSGFQSIDGVVPNNDMRFIMYYNDNPNGGGTSNIEFYWPTEGSILRNDTWNDYGIYVNLEEDWKECILKLTSNHEEGNIYFYSDWVSTSTEIYSWTYEKDDMPDGEVISNAELLCTNLENCNNKLEPWCIHYTVGTDLVNWIASSTGYTLFDNPFLLQPGFTASSTADDNYWVTKFKQMYGYITQYLFPFGLIDQLLTATFIANKQTSTSTSPSITLGNIIGDEQAGNYASSTIISADIINNVTYAPWYPRFYNSLRYLIYFITTITVAQILFGFYSHDKYQK